MVKYLLDTNIISEPFRLQPNSAVIEKLDTHGDESAIASVTWHERARLTALGKPPSYADGQIAAIASANNLILVTRNVSDYETFTGIEIENWFE